MSITLIISLLLATIFIAFGFKRRSKRVRLLRTGIKVEGEVVRIKKEKSRDSTLNRIRYVFKPVVQFVANGELVTKISDIYSDPCPYNVGDKLTVIYNAENVDEFTLNDGPSLFLEIVFFGLGILIWLIAAGWLMFK